MKKLLLFLVTSLICLQSDAQWQRSSPDDQNIYGFLSYGTKLFAGTGSAGILLSNNNGGSWNSSNAGLSLTGVSCFAEVSGSVFAASEGVFRSTDGGANWINKSAGLPNRTVNAMLSNATTLFIGSDTGVYYSVNSGDSWTIGNNGFDGQVISMTQLDTLLIVGTGNYGVYFSGIANLNWKSRNNGLTNNNVNALAVKNTRLFAGTGGGGVFRSDNRGANWTAVNNGLTEKHVYGLLSYGEDLFAGTDSGVYISRNQGDSWERINQGLPDSSTVWTLVVHGDFLFAGLRLGPYGVCRRPLSEIATSLNETNQSDFDFVLYPNPGNERIYLRWQNMKLQVCKVNVFNLSGALLLSKTQMPENSEIKLETGGLPPGIYFVQVIQEGRSAVCKWIVE